MLLLGAVAASVVPAAKRARAEPVTLIAGMTALQVGAAAVSIVSGIVGMIDSANMKRTLRQISLQLGTVINLQYAIINELREMKLLILETAFISWRDSYARRLSSYNAHLLILFADYETNGLSERLTNDFEELSRECTLTTLDIGQMDVWAFNSFASGVATVLLTERVLRASAKRLAETKVQFVAPLTIWLDAQRPTSLPRIIDKTEADVNARIVALNARPRSYVTHDGYETTDRGRCYRKAKTTLTVSGDFENGFSGSNVYWADNTWRCREFPSELLRNDVPLSAQLAREKSGSLTLMSGAAIAPPQTIVIPVVPGFSPSEFAIVDDFNRERVAIYELMAVNAKQRIMLQQMRTFKMALS